MGPIAEGLHGFAHAQQRDPSSLRSVGMTDLGRSVGMTKVAGNPHRCIPCKLGAEPKTFLNSNYHFHRTACPNDRNTFALPELLPHSAGNRQSPIKKYQSKTYAIQSTAIFFSHHACPYAKVKPDCLVQCINGLWWWRIIYNSRSGC